jgi:quercetin dioxygenase-like cupin family protein
MAQENLKTISEATKGDSSPAAVLFSFNLAEEISRIRREKGWQEGPGRVTRMLAKAPGLRVALIVMRVGNQWDEHKTDSRISIQPVDGSVRFTLPGGSFDLHKGELLVLEPGIPHRVEALEDAAFVLTLS